MDDPLQELKRELQSEKCPAEVLQKVRERIALEHRQPGAGFGFAALAGAAAIVLLLMLGTVLWNPGQEPELSTSPEPGTTTVDAARVAEEAALSLACIGHLFLEAGNQSEAVLAKQALPPLRRAFITLQTTFENPKGP
jgi:hypothetical protein